MNKVHSHKLKKLALKYIEHSIVVFLLSVGFLIHLMLEAKRKLGQISFHQVILNNQDFHEDEIGLVKFIWLMCNFVPFNGVYHSTNKIQRGLYIVDGRVNRLCFKSNFINQIKAEDL